MVSYLMKFRFVLSIGMLLLGSVTGAADEPIDFNRLVSNPPGTQLRQQLRQLRSASNQDRDTAISVRLQAVGDDIGASVGLGSRICIEQRVNFAVAHWP